MIRREFIIGFLSIFIAIISGCTNRLFEEEDTGYVIIINRTESPIDIQIEILGPDGQSLLNFDGELDYIGGTPELDEEIPVTNGQTFSANVKFPATSKEYTHEFMAQCVSESTPSGEEITDAFFVEIITESEATFQQTEC
ncbi:hypothetical protein [Natrarchaeobius oligotrophus]|uniref:hypothetical protein n=1 Tax=Natrarchaeobius oligotrophus TaxID=3455743 RepID=UPI000F538CA5|nr:hypothetical protein [Natrarchaeobius chitinivorans]